MPNEITRLLNSKKCESDKDNIDSILTIKNRMLYVLYHDNTLICIGQGGGSIDRSIKA